ncbi:DUF6011 domain-containing protein [Dongia sp.]|uniref:DUF6011 domain-containing protein n=1 Tax=Dongia sp. TaxID=1977262 RepID=UPI0035B3EDB0
MTPYQQLKAAAPNLLGRDAEFANSLLAQWAERGSLSEKQMHWVGVLVERAAVPAPVEPARSAFTADLTQIRKLFEKASAAGLKFPKIRLEVNGTAIKLTPAPTTGRNPGFVYVHRLVDGEYRYAGKVSEVGTYYGHSGDGVLAAIQALAADPASAAAAHGHTTGNCCFCARLLSDPTSVEVGYGPICAERFGLPHGTVAKAIAA